MKKNVFMRAALLLLVLTLITSCFVGGTFAKYITSDTKAIESARVANWGVTVEIANDDSFSATYEEDTDPTDNVDTLTVEGSAKVVAPGTAGDLFELNISGTPEVDALVSIEADLELTGWVVGEEFYCPIVFTIDGTEYAWQSTYTSLDDFEKVVEDAIKDSAAYYEVGTPITENLDIDWAWAFEVDNAKDTVLGDAAASGNASTISLSATVIVAQVN